jgi:putative redox protein
VSTKQAMVKQVSGVTLAAKSDSGHWVMMDGGPTFGGSNAASSPKELLLMALGGCTANDVIPILKKKKVPVDSIDILLTGSVREEHPQIFTDIQIEYLIRGDGIDPADVERAIELSTTKYCSISAMLKEAVRISHSYKIIPRDESNVAVPLHTQMV